jgi:hypothetical protein
MSAESSQRLLAKERAPGRRYDLYWGQPSETFVDGVGGVFMSTSVSKIDFYKTTKSEPDPEAPGESLETREVVCRVILPTPQLVEFVINQIAGMTAHQQPLIEAFEKQTEAIKTLLKRISPSENA